MLDVLHFRNCRGIDTLTGPETYLLDLLGGYAADRFAMELTCSVSPTGGGATFADNLEERKIPFHPVEIAHLFSPRDARQVRQRLVSGQVDLLHTHDCRSNALGWLALRGTTVPWVVFAHGWLNWESRWSKDRLYAGLEAALVARADHVIVASAHMHRDLVGRGIPERRMTCIPYGIDVDRFQPGPSDPAVRAELGIPKAAFLIGTIGRIHPWKGHRHLVEAAARIVAVRSDAHFLLVGDIAFEAHRRFKDELVRQIEALGLGAHFTLAGTRRDTPRLLNAMDLFVLPSTREPFGIVMLEAQACGRAVIGTRVDGIPETVRENDTALLVEPADAAALADAVLGLMNEPATRTAMGAAGRRRVAGEFSVPVMVHRTQELYTEVCARHGRRGAASAGGGRGTAATS